MPTSSRNFCKSKHSISFLQMLVHPNKMGNLEMINLLCENSSKHIAALFPDGEIHVHQASQQVLRFTWMRLCVCSLYHFPAPAHIPPSLLCLLKEGLTCSQPYSKCELIDCHLFSCFTCNIDELWPNQLPLLCSSQWHLILGVHF